MDADLRSAKWIRAIPRGRYDAALSSTALHWLQGSELARLYRDLARVLRPGGIFLNADGIAFDLASHQIRKASRVVWATLRARRARPRRRTGEDWESWWKAVARDPALREELRVHRERFPGDHRDVPTPDLAGHVRRLRAAGFREVELIYSRSASRVIAAVR